MIHLFLISVVGEDIVLVVVPHIICLQIFTLSNVNQRSVQVHLFYVMGTHVRLLEQWTFHSLSFKKLELSKSANIPIGISCPLSTLLYIVPIGLRSTFYPNKPCYLPTTTTTTTEPHHLYTAMMYFKEVT